MHLYPIKFIPVLKEKVWGGKKLKTLLYKQSSSDFIGESWEISGVEGTVSVVENGQYQGKNLNRLIAEYQSDLVGKSVFGNFGNQFPLLFKFIDAKEDLSVQLHPDDAVAKKRHNSFGKTEMWYIMQADNDARIIVGFNQKMKKELYQKHLVENTLETILHSEKVKEGDVFYITPGRVHAIGAGVLLAEIQQTSDITYRIYDWNRPDINGQMRELHQDLALDVIDFSDYKNSQIINKEKEIQTLISNAYFETSLIKTENKIVERDLSKIDSFVVYMCVAGAADISVNANTESIKTGECVLIPAKANQVQIEGLHANLLEVYVPQP